MLSKRIVRKIVEVVQANKGVSADQQAWMVQSYVQDEPVIGHMLLEELVDDGHLEIDEHGDEIRYAAVASPPAK